MSEQTTPVQRTVDLDTPIVRGDTTVASILLRKPKSGELHGLNMADIVQLNVGALAKLLPRITTPPLTENEINELDPADFLALSAEIADFLTPRRAKQDFPA